MTRAQKWLAATACALSLTVTSHASAQHVYVEVQPAPVYYVPPHLRFALGATAGGFIGTTLDSGFLGGLWGQVGLQINRLFGVYYQVHLMLGGYAEPGGVQLGGFGFNELMFDVTLGDVFQIGAGPSVDFFSLCDGHYYSNCDVAHLGFDGRLGLVFPRWRSWQRSGFMLGVDVHPTFMGSQMGDTSLSTAVLLTLGGGFF